MAQGTIKKSNAKAPARRPNNPGAKWGAKVIKPKKDSLIKRNAMIKKHSAGMTAKTEKALAEKAGHLEILKGGKKDRKAAEAAKNKK